MTSSIMPAQIKKLQDFKDWLAFLVATAGGAGLVPKAPGTAGALVALPLVWWAAGCSIASQICGLLVLTAVGTWAAARFDRNQQTSDNQSIVIDEVIGMWLTALTAGRHGLTLFAAFVAFRFFDVTKLPPVRQVDRWSKKQKNSLARGWGVIADDILAGIQGWILISLLQKGGLLP